MKSSASAKATPFGQLEYCPLFDTLIPGNGRIITITGAGGKTSLMFLLAHEFQKRSVPVITATTTRILRPNPEQSAHVLLLDKEKNTAARLAEQLAAHGHVTLAKHPLADDKLAGLPCTVLEQIFADSPAKRMIIEADGARTLPLKAPGENEPVVPQSTDLFIAVAGLDCIGRPLTEEHVFRPELVAKCTGTQLGSMITPETIVRLAVHPRGMFKGCPPETKKCIFLNKTDISGGENLAGQVGAAAKNSTRRKYPATWIAGSIRENTCFVVWNNTIRPDPEDGLS